MASIVLVGRAHRRAHLGRLLLRGTHDSRLLPRLAVQPDGGLGLGLGLGLGWLGWLGWLGGLGLGLGLGSPDGGRRAHGLHVVGQLALVELDALLRG